MYQREDAAALGIGDAVQFGLQKSGDTLADKRKVRRLASSVLRERVPYQGLK